MVAVVFLCQITMTSFIIPYKHQAAVFKREKRGEGNHLLMPKAG